MRHSIILIVLLFTLISCSTNKIDTLKTDKDIFAFLHQIPNNYIHYDRFSKYRNETIKIADSLKVCNWVKIDIDNNGETDLLVFRANDFPEIFAVLSLDGKYYTNAAKYFCKYQFIYPIVKEIDGQNVIFIYSQNQIGFDKESHRFIYTKLTCDTLIIKDNLFLNYVKKPKLFNIERIEVNNDGICEGDCPRICITINPRTFENRCSKEISWENNPKKIFGQLSNVQIKKLLSLLNYSNFDEFRNSYKVGCTDQTTTTLTITYNGGKIKRIQDYGSSGNFTLSEFYNIVYDVKWMEAK